MSDIHGDNHDREGQNDLTDAMHKEQSMRERLSPTDKKQIQEDISRLDSIIEKGKRFFSKFPSHMNRPVKSEATHRFVTELAKKWKVGVPEPTVQDTVQAAELIKEKMENRLGLDQIDEQAAKALENAEQLTVDDHGNSEVNPVPEGYHDEFDAAMILAWDDPRLERITRARWIGDPGIGVDLSYCHGVTTDGLDARVALPYELHHIRGATSERALRKVILDVAKKKGVYAKGTGIFEAISLYVN